MVQRIKPLPVRVAFAGFSSPGSALTPVYICAPALRSVGLSHAPPARLSKDRGRGGEVAPLLPIGIVKSMRHVQDILRLARYLARVMAPHPVREEPAET
jgi:hypothetical protein